MIIPTKDLQGQPNGWLMTLWNATERPDLRPEQVYLTVVAPGATKGPHLHRKREQRYYCIRGEARVIWRERDGSYQQAAMTPGARLVIPAGTPSQLVNAGAEEAWLLNMPAPAWTADDPDEWAVEDWRP